MTEVQYKPVAAGAVREGRCNFQADARPWPQTGYGTAAPVPCATTQDKEGFMPFEPDPPELCDPPQRRAAGMPAAADARDENKTMTGPQHPGRRDAGALEADIGSFRLHLAAEGKAARTVQGYAGAVRWFAAGYLLPQTGKTSWEQVDRQDIQQWIEQLLHRYSGAYASIQFRALRHRHLPDRRPPRPAMRRDRLPAPVPAPFQSHLAGPRRSRTRPDGAERLDLPADAHPVRRQRPRRQRPPQLRPHHGRYPLTYGHDGGPQLPHGMAVSPDSRR